MTQAEEEGIWQYMPTPVSMDYGFSPRDFNGATHKSNLRPTSATPNLGTQTLLLFNGHSWLKDGDRKPVTRGCCLFGTNKMHHWVF